MKYLYISLNLLILFLLKVNNQETQIVVIGGIIIFSLYHFLNLIKPSKGNKYQWFLYLPFNLYYTVLLIQGAFSGGLCYLVVAALGTYLMVMIREIIKSFKGIGLTHKAMETTLFVLMVGAIYPMAYGSILALVYGLILLIGVVSVHLLKRELTLQMNKPLILGATAIAFLLFGQYAPLISLVALTLYMAVLYYYDSDRWLEAHVLPLALVAIHLL